VFDHEAMQRIEAHCPSLARARASR
jgi:hypothetical protein